MEYLSHANDKMDGETTFSNPGSEHKDEWSGTLKKRILKNSGCMVYPQYGRTSEFWCRMWPEQAGLRSDSFMTLVLQQLLLQLPHDTLSLQTKYVSLVWPRRVRTKWWSFSFHLYLPYPSKGKLATSNNTLAMTNIKVIVGSDISRGFWLRRGSSKPKGSSQMDSKTHREKGRLRVGGECIYSECDGSH